LKTHFDNEEHTVSYSAYYGIFDFMYMNEPHTPSFWVFFSEGDDAALQKQLDELSARPLTQAYIAE